MQTQHFNHGDGTLAYSDYGGDGNPVLMRPGMGAMRSEYRFFSPSLSEAGFRALTVDLRGQGDSSVPWEPYDVPSVGGDILALIDHLGAGPGEEGRIIAELTGGELALIEGAGHYPQTEMPDITSPIMLDFLKRFKS